MKELIVNEIVRKCMLYIHFAIITFFNTALDDEEMKFYHLSDKLKMYLIALPEPIRDSVNTFVKERIEPLVFEPETLIPNNADGTITYKDYWKLWDEAEESWNAFAEQTLRPYLIA